MSSRNLSFTLRGVEKSSGTGMVLSKKTSGRPGTEKLIKSTKSLVIKTTKPESSFFDRSNLKNCLRARFNDVLVNKKGVEYPSDCRYPCDWCRRQFDHEPLGIPLSYRKREDGTNAYTCDGWLCSFECTLAFVRRDASAYAGGRDPLYRDAEAFLFNLFTKLYPTRKLRAAPDWRLLRDNGGDLGDGDAAKFTPYIRTANVKITPMSVIYQQY